MSIISNSFKVNAATKLAKSLGIENDKDLKLVIDAWAKGFDVAESMFTEQN